METNTSNTNKIHNIEVRGIKMVPFSLSRNVSPCLMIQAQLC